MVHAFVEPAVEDGLVVGLGSGVFCRGVKVELDVVSGEVDELFECDNLLEGEGEARDDLLVDMCHGLAGLVAVSVVNGVGDAPVDVRVVGRVEYLMCRGVILPDEVVLCELLSHQGCAVGSRQGDCPRLF